MENLNSQRFLMVDPRTGRAVELSGRSSSLLRHAAASELTAGSGSMELDVLAAELVVIPLAGSRRPEKRVS